MKRAALTLLLLAFLFAMAGCWRETADQKFTRNGEKDKAAGGSTKYFEKSAEPREGSTPAGNSASSETPEVMIRTENQISNQEASDMLDDVDKQLTDLLDTLDRLDDIAENELEY